jgi:hypothetical protein
MIGEYSGRVNDFKKTNLAWLPGVQVGFRKIDFLKLLTTNLQVLSMVSVTQ